jgi:hypothetical protein
MAFLLRTILEKALTKAMLKNGFRDRIIDKTRPKRYVALEKMIDLATEARTNGVPILTQQTAKADHFAQFLGNTAAHHLYASVDLSSLSTSAPQIKTAILELSKKL